MDNKQYNFSDILAGVAPQSESHTINEKFTEICVHMGVSPENFKRDHYSDQSRYCFSEKGYLFWVEALGHITEEPYKSIRKNDMLHVPRAFIKKFMDIVREDMTACGKSPSEIQIVLHRIDCATSYSLRIIHDECARAVNRFAKDFIEKLERAGQLTIEDRMTLIKYTAENILNPYLNGVCDEAGYYIDYLNSERIEEVGKIALGIDRDGVMHSGSDVDRVVAADRMLDEFYPESKPSEFVPKGKPGSMAYESHKVKEFVKGIRKYQKKQEMIDKQENISWEERHKPETIDRRSAENILKEAEEEI